MNLPQRDDFHPRTSKVEVVQSFPMKEYVSLEDEGSNLLDYWRSFKKRWWKVLALLIIPPLAAYIITLYLPKKYTAEVSLIPLSTSSGGGLSSIAAQISSIPLLGSQMGGLGSTKTKEIVNILKSKSLTEKLITRFDLLKVIFADRLDPTTKNFISNPPPLESGVFLFHKHYLFVQEEKKTGLINIQLTMKDPELGAKVANQMIVELQDFIINNSLTIAKRNRLFIEEQLVKNAGKLLDAGKELNQFYADNKISSINPSLDVNVGAFEALPKSFEEFRKKLNSYQVELDNSEKKKEQVIVKRVPGQVYLQYLVLNRELLAKAHALLMQQYELAKIEEAKEDLAFQVLDQAKVKVNPSSPSLKMNLAFGCVLGGFLAMALVFFGEYIDKLKAKEARRAKLG